MYLADLHDEGLSPRRSGCLARCISSDPACPLIPRVLAGVTAPNEDYQTPLKAIDSAIKQNALGLHRLKAPKLRVGGVGTNIDALVTLSDELSRLDVNLTAFLKKADRTFADALKNNPDTEGKQPPARGARADEEEKEVSQLLITVGGKKGTPSGAEQRVPCVEGESCVSPAPHLFL